MNTEKNLGFGFGLAFILVAPALADWRFNSGEVPNALLQTDKTILALECDRIRFAPAGYEDSQDILKRGGLSLRFMKNATTETASFQVGEVNASVQLVDNYPVEIVFNNASDYQFVQEQMSKNATLNLSMIDQDVSYGFFDLKGSGAAIRSLKAACAGAASSNRSMEAPEGVVYCGGGGVKRQIEYVILAKPTDQWDARVTVNGKTQKAMTAYSFFGNAKPPQGFVVALLPEEQGGGEFLVFKDGKKNWLEFGDYQYDQCN
jgi:hypothetical protein